MKIDHIRAAARRCAPLPLAVSLLLLATPVPALAAASTAHPARANAASLAVPLAAGAASLESAANKAGETGRKVAMSMIALGFAIAAIVLAFRRDFREAAGIFAIGIMAILLATPAGVNVLHDTVNTLFGG
ncbi:MAG TPA: hypothetical protein VHU13_05390 [Solirubrobacteraceae bacterium]|jgi:hypothetical protein|nr:hypothetical protein [Solirubrobacteraceae bacterium]